MMDNKKRFMNRMLGFMQGRDEREEQLINEKMTYLFLNSFWILLLFLFISFAVDAYQNTLSVGTVLILVLVLFNAVSVLITLKKADVYKEVVYSKEAYHAMLKKVRFQCIFASVLFLVISLLINILFAFLSHQRLTFSDINFLGWLIGSILFGIVSYYYAKSKITIEK
ncbi:hypothetical protein [Staphylococcus delphini]|uniref:DUF3278 domain-containing protein n=1 Tax=Staphylococcus delphini TaxID=53344 RepID=A0AAQ0IG68_9STAP|nr:hypothetical protein [Staphylococcus delphini]QUM66938.1 hypothetical protein IPU21_12770 [Staphylococcus delphini]QUM69381.1 hypothetical protein IPU22_12725 [Staphylococcus delphini]